MRNARTLVTATTWSQEIKKSRFLAHAMPVDQPEAALALITRISDPNATHNCWAYRIGQTYRFSDDGEPASTAGKPILQAIDGQNLDRIAVVVTRWFGGIKLGVGGLVRAYGSTTAECLRQAPQRPLVILCRLRVRCEFQVLPVLQARLREFDAEKVEEHFDARGVKLIVSLPEVQVAVFRHLLRDLTRGRGVIEEI